jgi:hypothetical protein
VGQFERNTTSLSLIVADPNAPKSTPLPKPAPTPKPFAGVPTIVGAAIPTVGASLHVLLPKSLASGKAISYRWQKLDTAAAKGKIAPVWKPLTNATKATLKLTSSLIGCELRVVVTIDGKTYTSVATTPVRRKR